MMLRLLIKSIAFSDSDQITFSLSTFFFITFSLSNCTLDWWSSSSIAQPLAHNWPVANQSVADHSIECQLMMMGS